MNKNQKLVRHEKNDQTTENQTNETYIDTHVQEEKKSKKYIFLSVAIGLIIIIAFFIKNSNHMPDQKLYDEAIDILEEEFAEPNDLTVEYSSKEKTVIETTKKDHYIVKGKLSDNTGAKSTFKVKIHVDENYLHYEWMVD